MTEKFDLQVNTLGNELIRLEPIREHDFDRLFALASDPLIWEVHPSKDRYKKEVFREYFNIAITSGSAFVVFDQANDEVIGSSRYYALQPDFSSVAIGYTFLARNYWGGKYNKALKKLMIDYAFRFVPVVLFHIGSTNFRSQQAILKMGAIKSREIEFESGGVMQPHFEYEILRSQWIGA